MTTAAKQETEFPNDLKTVSVVMFHLNVTDKRLVPKGIKWVKEPAPEAKPKHKPGVLIFKTKHLDTTDILGDVEVSGYILTGLQAVERRRGFRVSGLLVHEDKLAKDAKRLPLEDNARLQEMLALGVWDVMVFRNPGEEGGNFSFECGNPLPGRSSADSLIVGDDDSVEVSRP